jgi:hypothetical protein
MADRSPLIRTSLPGDMIEAARKALGLPEDISMPDLGRAVFAHAAGMPVPRMPRGAKPGNFSNGWGDSRHAKSSTAA